MKTGGGFGRRGVFDADVLAEAVAVAKAVDWKYPVKVQWTRNNDMQAGRYRPAYVHTMKAGLDAKGNLIAWHNHVVGQSILAGTPFQHIVKNNVDPTSVGYGVQVALWRAEHEGGAHHHDPTVCLSCSGVLWVQAMRSTPSRRFSTRSPRRPGRTLCRVPPGAAGEDARVTAVLKLAAEKAGWDLPLAAGRFRGVALAEAFDSVVAQVVEELSQCLRPAR